MNETNHRKPIEPTKSELEILQVLWEKGPATVRDVYNELQKRKDVIYTTTLKQMQLMVEKGILSREESQMKHIYRVAEDEQKTKDHLLGKFIDSMYKGSASNLMVALLGNSKTSPAEKMKIKELLNQMGDNL